MALLLFVPAKAMAAGEFQADYDVQYAIAPTGKTIVTQQVTLTNKLANFYPQEYTLLLDSDKIANIIAYDDGGLITPGISIKDGKTEIRLVFNVKAIGLGKSMTFSLRYEHAGIASKNGKIWEIYVPGVINDSDMGIYDVTLAVPPTFGPAAYLSPRPAKGKTWTKDQMIRGGIAGAYGSSQDFELTLSYTLENASVVSEIQEIALPPSTAYQKVVIHSLDPEPDTVISDKDGNWIARYRVGPRKSVRVKADVTVFVYLSPRTEFEAPDMIESDYLKEQPYWEKNNEAIVRLAKTYDTPKEIYEYVSTTLKYDFSKVNAPAPRMGAVSVLSSPDQAVCMEFTDLFIAIARAAGIPARRIVGYAYTNNPKLRPLSLVSDVLHAWPEYYDTDAKLWVPVDPTWSNTTGGVDYFTKLDFNHIAFAINGINSASPYPAGYYRAPASSGRDVIVEFTDDPKDKGSNVTTSMEFPDSVGGGTKVSGFLVVMNKGGESAYNISVSIVSEHGGIRETRVISELLPYGVVRIPIRGTFEHTLVTKSGRIHARVNDVTLTHSFRVQPLYWMIAVFGLVVVLIVITAVKLVSVVWKRQNKR